MRRNPLLILGAALLLTALPTVADEPEPEADDGLDVFFRDSDLEAVATQELAKYGELGPGESELLPRSFVSAPPQIPHSMEDLLPIRVDDNVCLECHLPENAGDEGATAIPESHFMRPQIVGTPGTDSGGEGAQVVVVAGYQRSDDLTGFSFNCVLCHVPQAENTREPASTFTGGEYAGN